jgi:spermidine/putrescine transport system ATP-binding protein
VTIVVRPEHADVVPQGQPAALTGSLSNVVYFGTDTHYHVALDNGGEFIVRHQNSRGGESPFKEGEKVGIAFEPDAAQVLRD